MTKNARGPFFDRYNKQVGKAFKDIFKVATATMGSRILGLVRDSASMAYLGIGSVSAAYTFAFTFPNLFRRLLGEGALTAAMIPTFTQSLEDGGRSAAFEFLNKVLTRAALIIAVAVIVFAAVAAAIGWCATGEERFILGAKYTSVLMPYMWFICLAATISAALNVLGSFGVPSVGPAVLNAAIITSIFTGAFFYGNSPRKIAMFMCIGWLVGGFFQLAIPAAYAYKLGWRFKFDLGKCDALGELYRLFAPACIAAAVIQINILFSKIFALLINDTALPALYISSRLVELPLGVFTVAIATVYFPKLARLSAKSASSDYKREYARGLLFTMCVSVPAAFGLAASGRDVLSMLFEWGIFNSKDVSLCLPVLIASVAALPMYALSTFATRGFHSAKDMKTPLKISVAVIAVNIAASVLLMFKFGAVGLAAANTLAAVFQAAYLNRRLHKSFGRFGTGMEILKILCASVLMALFVIGAREGLGAFFEGKTLSACVCCGVIPIAVAVYAVFLKIFGFKQLDDLNKVLKRR